MASAQSVLCSRHGQHFTEETARLTWIEMDNFTWLSADDPPPPCRHLLVLRFHGLGRYFSTLTKIWILFRCYGGWAALSMLRTELLLNFSGLCRIIAQHARFQHKAWRIGEGINLVFFSIQLTGWLDKNYTCMSSLTDFFRLVSICGMVWWFNEKYILWRLMMM